MSVRYLRRPVKARVGKKAVAARVKNALPGGSSSGVIAVDVTSDEREHLAQALAYFCVACGREHAAGEVRACDVARAEAEIIAAIRHCQ